jgi:hypothetical protein
LCLECKGIFSELVDERAYLRPDNYTCKTCGRGAHFEQNAASWRKWDGADTPHAKLHESESSFEPDFWLGLGLPGRMPVRRLRVAANANEIPAGDIGPAFVRDLDGSPIFDLLDEQQLSDGRRRTATGGESSPLGSGSAGWKGFSESVFDVFTEGGWIVEKVGKTGNEPGPQKRGSPQPWPQVSGLALILRMDKPGKAILGELLDADRGVNVDDLANHSAEAGYRRRKLRPENGYETKPATLSRASLFRYREKVRQNSPKSGGTTNVRAIQPVIHRCAFCPDWSANNLEEQTEHILTAHGIANRKQSTNVATRDDIAALRDQMREEHDELVRILFAFRYGETPIEAWERLLQEAA